MADQLQGTTLQSSGHSSLSSNDTTTCICTCRETPTDRIRRLLEVLQEVKYGDGDVSSSSWEEKFSKPRKEKYLRDSPIWGTGELSEAALKFPLGRAPSVYEPRSHSDLEEFLRKAVPEVILAKTPTAKVAILDLRNDDGLEPPEKFGPYPAEGNSVQLLLSDEAELYDALAKNRLESGAYRRIVHANSLTPNVAFIWAATCSLYTHDELRDFLSRTMRLNAYISARIAYRFILEFHIPYYRLVPGKIHSDPRKLRKSSSFPPFGQTSDYNLYQAQWSVLLVGFDESYWTCYCCPDLYMQGGGINYRKSDISWDRSSGRPLEHPVWDPREYFLHCLRNCMGNVVKDWSRVLKVLDDKISAPINVVFGEGNIEDFLSDDSKFTRSRLYDWALQALTTFQESLQSVVGSWEKLYEDEIKHLHEKGPSGNRISREEILSGIDKDIQALRKMSQRIDSQILRLCTLRDGVSLKLTLTCTLSIISYLDQGHICCGSTLIQMVIGFSALKESRATTKQSADLKFLTMVAAIFLPYQCVTGTFALNPFQGSSLKSILCTIILFTIATMFVTFNLPRLVRSSTPKLLQISGELLQKMESTECWKWRTPGLRARRKKPELDCQESTQSNSESYWWYVLFAIDYYLIKGPSSELIKFLGAPSKMGWLRKSCVPIWSLLCLVEFTLLVILWALACSAQLLYKTTQHEDLDYATYFLNVIHGPANFIGVQNVWVSWQGDHDSGNRTDLDSAAVSSDD